MFWLHWGELTPHDVLLLRFSALNLCITRCLPKSQSPSQCVLIHQCSCVCNEFVCGFTYYPSRLLWSHSKSKSRFSNAFQRHTYSRVGYFLMSREYAGVNSIFLYMSIVLCAVALVEVNKRWYLLFNIVFLLEFLYLKTENILNCY